VDLADEPVVPATRKLALAALALHLGLAYEAPGVRLDPPTYAAVDTGAATLAVIGTGKRTGKTAVAGHWAALLRDRGAEPVVVCMGRGGPAEPRTAQAGIGVDELLEIDAGGEHAASDYLEGAALAGVPTVGCRRVGGGLAGAPAESNVAAGAALAAALGPAAILFEGSGACIPPVEVERTVCVVGRGAPEPFAEYRLLRADLVLAPAGAPAPPGAVEFELRPEPVEPLPDVARVALFTTGAEHCEGVEPIVSSANLARRGALAEDLDRAAAAGCDVYLT
jgi:cyclic 2,3-diphosphoglycerate synthase